jgi:iron complex outermembrane receptor protein
MTVSSRAKHLSAGLVFLLSTTMLSGIAHAQDSGADATEIVIVGKGQSRSVTTLVPANLDVLPPGTSIQKSLNFLPGVMAQSIDALGVNEQSLSLQVRGFSTTHLGYSLDGMPLGDGAYNNYNGLTISRALISENLGRADLATGIAGLSIPSTSNLGGALIYTSSNPRKDFGATASQTFGDEKSARTYLRVDTGEHAGFSAYLSGQYSEQNLFVNQAAYNKSYGAQLNGKAQYRMDRVTFTAFADISHTNQADDPYLSKDMLSRLGPDWGGYAPDWASYLKVASCGVTSLVSKCVAAPSPQKNADVTFTNGQILRNDNLYYLATDVDLTDHVKARVLVYSHTDRGAGNNFITGLSNQGTTADTSDDLPVQIRDTRYTIDREGVVGTLTWDAGFNHVQAGFWLEKNTSSAARYIWTNVKGPFSLAHFMTVDGQPDTAQWVQETQWRTQQYYVQDTVKLFDDALNIDFGFKSTDATSDAQALPGVAKAPAPLPTAPGTTQFATGSLKAKDNFLPEVGVRWTIAPGHEVYASYSENMAMYQGGFKLGPQSVSQAVWDVQGATLKPETSKGIDAGYRYISRPLQISVAAYDVDFDNRLLQYNPCPTNQQQNPGCGNSFHNAGSVSSKGVEVGVLWRPLNWLSWYNSASFNKTVYNDNLNWSTGASTSVVLPTAGKQQVDTPKEMFASTLNLKHGGFWGTLTGKYTGERFYTYTNDQGFPAVTTFDLGFGYNFGTTGLLKGAKLAVNVTNLTNKRYAANFDNSVFAPSDSGITANGDSNAVAGDVLVFHTSAPRQVFVTLGYGF